MRIGQDGSNRTGRNAGCAGRATVTGVPSRHRYRLRPGEARISVVPAKAAQQPQTRDPYAAAYREGTAYGSLLSQGRRWSKHSLPWSKKGRKRILAPSHPKKLAVADLDLLGLRLDGRRIIRHDLDLRQGPAPRFLRHLGMGR